jgi:hypothetical protein
LSLHPSPLVLAKKRSIGQACLCEKDKAQPDTE